MPADDARPPENLIHHSAVILVKARATIAPVIENRDVWFKVFDVDDPSTNAPPVDVETNSTDNRGTHMPTGVQSNKTNAAGQVELEIEVGMQPGDNYRVVASTLEDFFDNLEAKQNDGANARVWNPSGAGWFVRPKHRSLMLTVWRMLHVEVDSMGAVVGNEIDVPFTDFVGTGTAVTEVSGSNSMDDGSKDLDDTPPENGRFENGTIIIGSPPTTITISPLTGNGNNRVVFPSASIAGLPFSAIDNDSFGNGTIAGTITQVVKSGSNFVWSLTVTASNENPIDWPDFVGGTLSVGGGSDVPIVAANGTATTLTTSALNIPCKLRDDDVLLNGQDVPDPDVSGIAPIFKDAYIEPAFDTGADTASSPFHLHTRRLSDFCAHLNETRGGGSSTNDYWVVMAKNGYQTDADVAGGGDNDPDNEGTNRAFGSFRTGCQPGAILLEESIRDWITASVADGGAGGVDPDTSGARGRQFRRQEILNHELGHTFGLVHSDGDPVPGLEPFGGVMAASCCPPAFTRQASTFTQKSLDNIRRKDRPE